VSHTGLSRAGLDRDHDAQVLVMSVQTAWRRLDQLPRLDFMVLDEAHHAVSDTWSGLIGYRPKAKILGVTATPARLDGKGFGVEAGGFFDALVMGATVTDCRVSVSSLPHGSSFPDVRSTPPACVSDAGTLRSGS
jgi:hypothetical protein